MEKPFTQLLFWNDAMPRTPAGQMACDEALLGAAPLPVLRLYRWKQKAATFGYAQRLADVQKTTGGIPLARRWTGGGIVFHGEDLTIALAVPASASPPPPRSLYSLIHSAILGAVLNSIPAARLAAPSETIDGPACFSAPAVDDILAGSEKILGGAIRRTRSGTLYQGSLQSAEITPETLAQSLAAEVEVFADPSAVESQAARLAAEKYSTPAWLALR